MEKKKFRFNFIDAIVILVILAAVAFVGYFVLGGGFGGGESIKYEVTYLCEEVPSFAASIIKEGDKVLDEQKDTDLGVVTAVELSDSRTYTTTNEGEVLCVPKPYYNCVALTTEVEGSEYDFGMIAGSSKYGVGHSITIRVGSAKIFGRVSGIKRID
ncbi:MAG: DUF4330 domain-containing protein [Clostridia bacterium]|nr:DUF4330 domain-containing protein [Clostridia bacterium]